MGNRANLHDHEAIAHGVEVKSMHLARPSRGDHSTAPLNRGDCGVICLGPTDYDRSESPVSWVVPIPPAVTRTRCLGLMSEPPTRHPLPQPLSRTFWIWMSAYNEKADIARSSEKNGLAKHGLCRLLAQNTHSAQSLRRHGIREITDPRARATVYRPMTDPIRRDREGQFLTQMRRSQTAVLRLSVFDDSQRCFSLLREASLDKVFDHPGFD